MSGLQPAAAANDEDASTNSVLGQVLRGCGLTQVDLEGAETANDDDGNAASFAVLQNVEVVGAEVSVERDYSPI